MFCLILNHLVLALVPFGIVYLQLVHNRFVWVLAVYFVHALCS